MCPRWPGASSKSIGLRPSPIPSRRSCASRGRCGSAASRSRPACPGSPAGTHASANAASGVNYARADEGVRCRRDVGKSRRLRSRCAPLRSDKLASWMGMSGATQPQARLGRYELLARLATGGMGEIFLAKLEGAEGFEKLYVVKRILAHLADDARFRQMLVAEAQIASKMSHPNICQVFELGETDGQLYIVMEYLEGVSLLPLLRRFSRENTALDLGFVSGVIQQVTDAMNYAHELKDRDGGFLGIIHRDVTPSNIFLTDSGVAKVLDFGIAKARGASTQTQEGTVKGKYAYMAPEQLKGSAIDRRVDIFALGVVLYEMLALRRLFQRKTDYLTFRAVMEQPIPDIRHYRPDLPEAVADTIARALDRDPGTRFETARQFGTAILDGTQGIRPWTQGEISDFVRHHFADQIGKRSQQVASVVHRTASG